MVTIHYSSSFISFRQLQEDAAYCSVRKMLPGCHQRKSEPQTTTKYKPTFANFFSVYSRVYSSHCHIPSTHAKNNVDFVLSSPICSSESGKGVRNRRTKKARKMFPFTCIDTAQRIQTLSTNFL